MYIVSNKGTYYPVYGREHKQSTVTFLSWLLATSILSIGFLTNTATAAIYYVDAADGNDSNPGTSELPWKSLNRAYTSYDGSPKVQEGDTVLFRDGDYGEFRENTGDTAFWIDNYHDRNNWVTYKADAGHEPQLETITIKNAGSPGGVFTWGRSYLRFEDFDIADGVSIEYTQYVYLKNCNITKNPLSYEGIYAPYYADKMDPVLAINTNYITVEDCTLFNGAEGIYTRNGNHWIIRNNTIYHYCTDGIKYTSVSDLLIEDNLIYDVDTLRANWLIFGSLSGTFIPGETIIQSGTGAVGIFHSGGTNNIVFFRNSATNFATQAQGGGTITGQSSGATLSDTYNLDSPGSDGIETHSSSTDVIIRRNKLLINGSLQGIVLYGYGGTVNYTVENNLVVGAIKSFVVAGGTVGIKINNNTGIGGYFRFQIERDETVIVEEFYNNILTECRQNDDDGGKYIRILNHGNNIFGNNPDGQGGPAYPFSVNETELVNHNLVSLFVDASNNDFQLVGGSIAIDFGNSDYAPVTDILGVSRVFPPDAGCYEYIPSDPNNLAPTADAGSDQTVTDSDGNGSEPVTLDASNSDDPDGTITSYTWYEGANQIATGQQPTVVLNVGTHNILLRVIDDDGGTNTDTVTVTVKGGNQAPTADAGTDQTLTDDDGNGSEQVILDASNSDDPDGSIVSYVWNEGATQIATGQQPTVTLNIGTHIITLTVTDDDGGTDTDTVTVTVKGGNQAPTADAGTDQTLTDDDGNGSEPVTLDASNSEDPDGTIVSYVWNEGVTQIATGQQPTVALNVDTHNITLTVTDDDGATDTDTVTVTVNPGNQAPTANAGTDQNLTDDDGNGSEPVTLDGSSSGDWDGNIISYVWSEGANQIATGQQPTVALNIGTHTITLTVTDDDGATDTDTVTITINAIDTTAPTVTNTSPQANAIQVPLNTLVSLNITDSGHGVDADSVTIEVNGNVVYTGNTAKYNSVSGECYRIGTSAGYEFIYQSNETFDFDQSVNVTVNASDLAGNAMDEYSYSFQTEMRSFGKNIIVDSDDLTKGGPVTVRDSSGNIWVAWHAGMTGNKDIYINKLTAGSEAFGNSIKLTDSTADQRNPAVAVGTDDKLYVTWQDSRNGNWDIYVSTSTDGVNFSAEIRVTDSNDNQINPVIVVDSSIPNKAYIAWEDDRNGNQDIYIGVSNDGFVSTTTSQITSELSYQGEPAIAVDSDNTVYVVWIDRRNSGKNDIYGGASNNSWNDIPIVTEEHSQSSPAISSEAVGSILHLVWADDRSVDEDIYYAKTNGGLPTSPLSGSSIIDDTTNAVQKRPVIAVVGSTGSNLRAYACWQDERNGDDDLYLSEINSSSGTNVFVGDDGTNTDQTEPAIGIDGQDQPYLVWVDDRNMNTDIYYAGSTFIEPDVLASSTISTSSAVTVGTPVSAIDNLDDVSVEVPQGAYSCDIKISISKIQNSQEFNLERFGGPYEFSPSGIEFIKPVTITIPYEVSGSEDITYTAYWYNPLTNALSQQGITDIETIVISPTLHALRFKTTHFTQFYVFGSSNNNSSGISVSGGGGGCSMSPDSQAGAVELLLPYMGLTIAMVILKLRDRRKKKTCNIT